MRSPTENRVRLCECSWGASVQWSPTRNDTHSNSAGPQMKGSGPGASDFGTFDLEKVRSCRQTGQTEHGLGLRMAGVLEGNSFPSPPGRGETWSCGAKDGMQVSE